MAQFANAVLFLPVSIGTVDFVVSSAVQGYMTPALAGAVTGVYKYRAESNDLSQWEIGEGTYTSGTTTLTRTTVLYNSAGTGTAAGQSGAGTKINFSTVPQVGIVQAAQDMIGIDQANAFTTPQQAQAKSNIAVPPAGQCILTKVSSNLVLLPRNGNLLTINGKQCTVPDAGVSLAPTSLTPGGVYLIYATESGGVVNALEASATAHATSTTAGNKGVEIKSGDDTRSLVGMARIITGPAWADTASQRFVRSWFNDFGVTSIANLTAARSTTSTSFVQLHTEATAEFLSWAGEQVEGHASGAARNGLAPHACYTTIGYDSTSVAQPNGSYGNSAGGTYSVAFNAIALIQSAAEGYHFGTLLAKVSADTGTWEGTPDGSRSGIMMRTMR